MNFFSGGFKIWECSFDLVKYLSKHPDLVPSGSDAKILDLGCGAGILGMHVLSMGKSHVHFQDYVCKPLFGILLLDHYSGFQFLLLTFRILKSWNMLRYQMC